MKKILIFAILCCLLAGITSAYEIRIDAPQTLKLGDTIVVNGTTNLPAGVSFDIMLTRSEYTSEVKGTKHVTVQGDKNFSVEFPTTGFSKGIYKVEILPTGEFRYLGDSITMRVITLIDRSEEARLTSLPSQYMNGVLHVAGVAPNLRSDAIEMQAVNPDGTKLFGPTLVPTTIEGVFSKDLTIGQTGTYQVILSDHKGYIGTYNISVIEQVVTALPIATSQPERQAPALSSSTLSASAPSTRDEPAYFSVKTRSGPVMLSTSPGTDWVIEYTDPSGQRVKMNTKGSEYAEVLTVQGDGGVQYFTVYPNKYSDQATVTLYVDNADNISAVKQIPGSVPVVPVSGTTTTKSVFPLVPVLISLLLIALFWKKK